MANQNKVLLIFEAVDRASAFVSRQMASMSTKLETFSKKSAAFGRTAMTGAVAIGSGLAVAVNESIKFESSFAGVRKTVNATDEELKNLSESLLQMSKEIPVNINQLNDTAAAAGQLGIQTQNIAKFTRVISDLSVATNLGEDAAAELAKYANITKMAQGDFDRLGSTIVSLGNNMATTERDIMEFGMRLAGAGSQVGISQANIMGFGAALSSVGLEAEAGGTAMSKVFIDLAQATAKGGAQLERISKVAGMTSEEFAKAFKKNAAGATVSFIEGLGKIKAEGGNTFQVLEDLGYTEVRMRDALLRASGAGDILRKSLNLSSTAWDQNNALTKEATTRYGTAQSKLRIFQNEAIALAIKVGDVLVPVLLDLTKAISGVVEWAGKFATENPRLTRVIVIGTAALAAFLAVMAVVSYTASAVSGGLSALAWVFSLLTARTTYTTIATKAYTVAKWLATAATKAFQFAVMLGGGAIMGLRYGLTAAAGALRNLSIGQRIATAAQWAWNAAMYANPIGLIIAAIVIVIGVIAALVWKWHEFEAWFTKSPVWIQVVVVAFIGGFMAIAKIIRWLIDNWNDLPAAFSKVWEQIKARFMAVHESIVGRVRAIVNAFTGFHVRLFQAGKNIIKSIVDGMKSMAMAPINAISGIVGKVREFLPFSPAKRGPLRDIHRIRLVETIAESIKPAPMLSAIGRVARATMTAVPSMAMGGIRSIASGAASGGAGPITINFSPQITVNGGGPAAANGIMQELRGYGPELLRILKAEIAKQDRRKF